MDLYYLLNVEVHEHYLNLVTVILNICNFPVSIVGESDCLHYSSLIFVYGYAINFAQQSVGTKENLIHYADRARKYETNLVDYVQWMSNTQEFEDRALLSEVDK